VLAQQPAKTTYEQLVRFEIVSVERQHGDRPWAERGEGVHRD
jgi:hypothetical protein